MGLAFLRVVGLQQLLPNFVQHLLDSFLKDGDVLYYGAIYNICVYFEVVMCYLVSHSHHSIPVNLRILGQ